MNNIDIKIDNKLKKIISKSLKKDIESVKFDSVVYGGMSNNTYLYLVGDKKYVAHVSTYGYDLFIKRSWEFKALKELKNFELSQKPIYLSKNIRIFEYLDGISMNTIKYQDYYKEIALSFHKLHESTKSFKYTFGGLKYLDKIKGLVKEHEFVDLFNESYKILKDNEELLKSRKLYPCHNDLQPTNLVLKDKLVYILDFEYSSDNDYLYDIAAFGNIDFNDSLNLLKVYNPNYDDIELKCLKLWRIYINCLWYLTALKKEELGYNEVLKMNFSDVALMFLNKNRDIIDSL